jgi:hypothetical protein
MKRGGSKMGYTEQFNLLSPCYKDGEQRASDFRIGGAKAKPTKKGKPTKKAAKAKNPKKHKGGSSCYASPSVAEMGIVDKPASLEPTKSELAWDNRMTGGGNVNTVVGNNKKQTQIATTNLFSLNSLPVTVNSNNSPLNKIKNELFPTGTTPELVMKLIQTNKNLTNPSDSTYSFEIFYRLDGKNEIQKISKSNIKFGEFLKDYRDISTKVFPPPQKANANAVGVLNANAKAAANAKTAANAAANAKTAANAAAKAAPATAPAATTATAPIGGRKRKNNYK